MRVDLNKNAGTTFRVILGCREHILKVTMKFGQRLWADSGFIAMNIVSKWDNGKLRNETVKHKLTPGKMISVVSPARFWRETLECILEAYIFWKSVALKLSNARTVSRGPTENRSWTSECFRKVSMKLQSKSYRLLKCCNKILTEILVFSGSIWDLPPARFVQKHVGTTVGGSETWQHHRLVLTYPPVGPSGFLVAYR